MFQLFVATSILATNIGDCLTAMHMPNLQLRGSAKTFLFELIGDFLDNNLCSSAIVKIRGQFILRSVIWLGDSKKNILRFPEEVRKLIGDELQLIQFGGMPKDAKPFKGVGAGVIEIALKYDKGAYRCVQAVQCDRL